jgi:hypothetical protein
MATEITLYSVPDLQAMAGAMATTKMFGFKTREEAFALMLIAQAEGKHPATIAQDYDVIQGRPALKSVAALSRFQHAGGSIQWHERTDLAASATFKHKLGGEVTIEWTMERAKSAQLVGKDNWRKFPAQMLSARVVAEGVRACFPACLNGFYLAEEVQDFDPKTEPVQHAAKPTQRVEVSQAPPVDLANPDEVAALLADLKALNVTREQLAEVMGATKLKEMTTEQFAALDAMRHEIQSRNVETTETEPTENPE